MTQPVAQVPYFPNRDEYDRSVIGRSQEDPVKERLPHGFPKRLAGQMAWERDDISMDRRANGDTPYRLVLQDQQLTEIDAALRHFQSQSQTSIVCVSRLWLTSSLLQN